MTETTDTKALRRLSLQRVKEIANGGSVLMGEKVDLANTALHFYTELGEMTDAFKRAATELFTVQDQLEAERQRLELVREQRDNELKTNMQLEAELSAIRGTQEPVDELAIVAIADLFVIPSRNGVGSYYVTDAAEAMRISKRNDNSAIRQYVTMRRYQELFTRQPKPVVDDSMALAFHQALNDGGIGHSDLEEIKTGLRAALGIYDSGVVKDGE